MGISTFPPSNYSPVIPPFLRDGNESEAEPAEGEVADEMVDEPRLKVGAPSWMN